MTAAARSKPAQSKPTASKKTTSKRPQRGRQKAREPEKACYIYGVVSGDVEVMPDARGIGEPPYPVELVRHGDVAALISEIEVDRPLGRPDDLLAHERVLDATVADAPVLPIRFGAVVTDRDAVVDELLQAHHDEFARALAEMDGRAEYVVKARYVEEAVVGEVLAEDATARRLRDQLQGRPEEATRTERIELGEVINQAIEAKREADTAAVIAAVEPISVAQAIRPPTHDQDAAHVALLVETDRDRELEDALAGLAEQWAGRVSVRLLGPLAPYDFVVTPQQELTS